MMRYDLTIPILAAAFSVLATMAFAEPTATAKSEPAMIEMQDDDQILLKDLLGTPVMEAGGETIGEVEDLILSEDGTPMAIVVSTGGILSIGAKDVAVPWSRLIAYADDEEVDVLSMDVSREAIEAAPPFERRDPRVNGVKRVFMQEPLSVAPASGPPSSDDSGAQ